MPLITREERKLIKECAVYRDVVFDQTFDLITYFYPNQRLTIEILPKHFAAIMDDDDAYRIEEKFFNIESRLKRKGAHRLTLAELCAYLDIDEMLMQLYFASLSDSNPLPPTRRIDAEIAQTCFRSISEGSKELQQGILPSDEVYEKRLQLWDEQNPLGEVMYKRDGFYRVLIRTNEIAQIFNCHIDTARAMLRATLKEAGFPKSRHISIKKFCEINHYPESELRKALATIYGEDYTSE